MKPFMKPYLGQIGHFLLVLLAIQVGRGLIITGLWRILQPAKDSPIWAYMDMVAFGIVGISLLVFFRPSAAQIALDWKTIPRWELVIYIGLGIFILALIFSTYFLQPDLFAANLNSAIVIPIFEELLLRGWGWNQLEKVASFKGSLLINWLVISLLFGLWHFGYLSTQSCSIQSKHGLGNFLRDEASHYFPYRFDRWHPALADWTPLWFTDPAFAHQYIWAVEWNGPTCQSLEIIKPVECVPRVLCISLLLSVTLQILALSCFHWYHSQAAHLYSGPSIGYHPRQGHSM
ncbi:MAG TPA: CPBP family intramembrane glutamic endopeptidase [Anaerolineales bacterium]|nr:CPBP family intramembrane glutamic endopeptidase [Anaerolineales bacterium]